MNDLALAFFLPPDENPEKMPRGLVILGATALAALVFVFARQASAAAYMGGGGVPLPEPPKPGPGPIPPGPTPKPTGPKPGGGGGGQVPPWADPNPYGFNARPGDPYVAPDGLWVSEDCTRWKMGRQWFPQVAVPLIQQWMANGWTPTADGDDVYTSVGRTWAWGYEIAKGILKPYLEQSNPQGPLCWAGFPWPWDQRGRFSQGELVQVGQDFEVQCPYQTHERWKGSICVDSATIDNWEQEAENYAVNYPALFEWSGYGDGQDVGLIGLIWHVWYALGAGMAWDQIIQSDLQQLQLANA